MVKYSVEAVNAILLSVRQVPGRATFHTLWQLSQDLQKCLGKMEHPKHPYEGYAGYMMTPAAYVLYSTTIWQDPEDVGNYFIVPTTPAKNPKKRNGNRGRTYWAPTVTCAPPYENYSRDPSITHTIQEE